VAKRADVLSLFHPAVSEWFRGSFAAPTPPQTEGWPAIARGESTLILAPTGSGKTLTAFLWAINKVMFAAAVRSNSGAISPKPRSGEGGSTQRGGCRVLYISPLKALAVDVERNLRSPIAGIANRATARGDAFHLPAVAVRTGDTPAIERARFQREPADILITTPESLYLLLTSNARDALRTIDTVIVDEIHALVPTKRGAHMALSLERLTALVAAPMQRIGLSATQRPLDEVARFLGGALGSDRGQTGVGPGSDRGQGLRRVDPEDAIHDEFTSAEPSTPKSRSGPPSRRSGETGSGGRKYRDVTIVDTSQKKKLDLTIEVPVEDMARMGEPEDIPSGPASQSGARASIWTAIHPRLLELVRAHRSTLIFVNSRRIAERLASALNELAGEPLVRAHHGSLARPQRIEIEDKLKAGQIRGLVATSSLELGIDMGAIDLVIQIEAPPSVASGMQRIGRSGHTIDQPSRGIIVPKYRGDLVACAAVTRAMHEAQIESIRYPRNPLDVLAQQIVAMVAMETWNVDALFRAVRGAAPFAELSRSIFDGVLDMLSGRYPSDDFADLRPRLTWDRLKNEAVAREGAKRVAVVNGGTIPDRGLYGVFLVGERGPQARVGELDEEMVFESRVGETFLLGASSWRIEEISHDKVLVSPAPGQPGKMPFWKADAAGRPLELGRHIGELVRSLRQMPPAAAINRLTKHHDLDARAAENLLRYLADQASATGAVPDDRTIVIERTRDELGDWRMCLLSPFGSRVHAPWAMAVVERVRSELGADAETMWTDDGFVVRFPETETPPDPALLLPGSDEAEALVVRQLGGTALFAAKFREAAARALLLPRRRPGGRTPLWQQRKRAADLLAVAAKFGSFPMILEVYRELLRDVFDIPALVETLTRIEARDIRTVTVDSAIPSPFASALLFGYVANYIYDGDAPLAERRAQALSIDQAQLRELLGEAELRQLLDADALADVESQLQQLEARYRARSVDGVHDLLLHLGDLTHDEIEARAAVAAGAAIAQLTKDRRILPIRVGAPAAHFDRFIPVEYAARYRDALGVPLPVGLPESLLAPTPDAALDVARRYARTHGPFTTAEFADRYALGRSTAEALLKTLAAAGRLLEGEFRPGGSGREWCDADVLQTIRRRSLAKLRKEVEPVEPFVLARLVTSWQGLVRRRTGLDALLDIVENLQGAPLPASILESDILPARIDGYAAGDLDALAAAGEVVWRGVEPVGDRDGRIAIYLTDHIGRLWRPAAAPELSEREQGILSHLKRHGASFFAPLHEAAGGGYPGETVDALWDLVWKGILTNDTFHALRAFTRAPVRRGRKKARSTGPFRSRRVAPPSAEGRWSLLAERVPVPPSDTQWSTAMAQQLLSRYGVVTREVAAAEGLFGGFGAVYDVLKAFEDAGRVRRGYFVGVGATQFALPAALELLRALRELPEDPDVLVIAATDPANPYGTTLKWPASAKAPAGHAHDAKATAGQAPEAAEEAGRAPTRTVGALVVLVNGQLAAYIPRGGRQVVVYLPEDEPARSTTGRALARALALLARDEHRGGLLLAEINGQEPAHHPIAPFLIEAGFNPSAMGFQMRRPASAAGYSG
jgi:ATP-dependent Lhr-like helicase